MTMFDCHVCGNTTARSEYVNEIFTIDGRHVLVEHIPAEVCTRCGDPEFSAETAEKIRRAVRERAHVKTVPLDVLVLA